MKAPMPSAGLSSVPSVSVIFWVALWVAKQYHGLPFAAGAALAADGAPVEDDEVAGRHLGHALADRLDGAGRLVAEQEGELVVDAALAVVQVGVADPAGLDPHDGLARARGRARRCRRARPRLPWLRAMTPLTVWGTGPPGFGGMVRYAVTLRVGGGSSASAWSGRCGGETRGQDGNGERAPAQPRLAAHALPGVRRRDPRAAPAAHLRDARALDGHRLRRGARRDRPVRLGAVQTPQGPRPPGATPGSTGRCATGAR